MSVKIIYLSMRGKELNECLLLEAVLQIGHKINPIMDPVFPIFVYTNLNINTFTSHLILNVFQYLDDMVLANMIVNLAKCCLIHKTALIIAPSRNQEPVSDKSVHPLLMSNSVCFPSASTNHCLAD